MRQHIFDNQVISNDNWNRQTVRKIFRVVSGTHKKGSKQDPLNRYTHAHHQCTSTYAFMRGGAYSRAHASTCRIWAIHTGRGLPWVIILENKSMYYYQCTEQVDLTVWILKLTLLYFINYPWPWPWPWPLCLLCTVTIDARQHFHLPRGAGRQDKLYIRSMRLCRYSIANMIIIQTFDQ